MKFLFQNCLLVCLCISFKVNAQFAPQAPLPGNDAIPYDDNRIQEWANSCHLQRGWKNIADKSLGQTTSGDSSSAIGGYDATLVSLGDSGVATLSFEYAVRNGPGPDFAVFENGFADPLNPTMAYLELAFVEVSTDGQHFVRFPSVDNRQDTVQIDNFTYSDASLVNNLAGKYIAGYGTPFDLEELKDSAGIDVNNINFVRIVDVVGSINPAYASHDSEGKIINDAYPTEYPTGGFDLNGVAALNSNQPTGLSDLRLSDFHFFPNPVNDYLHFLTEKGESYQYSLYDINGKTVMNGTIRNKDNLNLSKLTAGLYIMEVKNRNGKICYKINKL